MPENAFGQKLVDYRQHRGWSREFVSMVSEVPWNTIWAWEEGRRVPPAYVQNMLFFLLDHKGLPPAVDNV